MDEDLHKDYDELRSFQRYYADGQIQRRVQSMYRFEDPAETVFDELLRRLGQVSEPPSAAAFGDAVPGEGARAAPAGSRMKAEE